MPRSLESNRLASLAESDRGLPALIRAEKLGEHARSLGMDWRDVRAVLAKVREELDEAEAALERGDRAAAAEELGDLMLALANAPRFLDCSAEETLSPRVRKVHRALRARRADSRATRARSAEPRRRRNRPAMERSQEDPSMTGALKEERRTS